MFTRVFLTGLLLCSCADQSVQKTTDSTTSRAVADQSTLLDASTDIYMLDFIFPDAYVDPCESVTSSQDNFCECHPACCQTQMWYCPPSGLGVQAAEVTMNICDENHNICDRSRDFSCPPNEVLARSDCNMVLECPPGIENNIRITVQCEIEGTQGEQQILCRKGEIIYEECVICEPKEERCNYEDDDCDGIIDENQRNACDTCGPLPSESCNGVDDDCNGNIDEEMVRECNTACDRGLETCNMGNWISCTARQPVEEICDGEDNDCDGRVDESLECLCTIEEVGNLIPCFESPLLCGQGFKTCECADLDCSEMRMTQCAALCSYLPVQNNDCDPRIGLVLNQEDCNNFDDDCDQNIDEQLTQSCYTGPNETLFVGVCSPGEVYCNRGSWGSDVNNIFTPGFCAGEITPQEEICDGADNDCDGEVDYGESIRDTDILFIVDWSGSMDDEIEAVKIALNQFAQQFSAEEALQWSLLVGPKENVGSAKEWLIKVTDVVPFEQFLHEFAALGNEGMDTGSEMLMDALYFSLRNISAPPPYDIAASQWVDNTGSNPDKEMFSVSWRPLAERIIILFSDEEPQSFLQPEITDEFLIQAFRSSVNTKFYAFVTPDLSGDQWDDIIASTSGARFRLTSNAVDMYNDLMSIIDEACLPRQDARASFFDNNRQKYMQYKFASDTDLRYDYRLGICF